MKLIAAMGLAACALAWSGVASAQQAKLCDKPKQMEGFKTCADVAKAEQEGEILFYTHDSEPAAAGVIEAFSKDFPKIKGK